VADNQQLSIPEAARKDPESIELLLMWLTGEQQHVSIRVGVWDDPAAWGVMLPDLARRVASTYQREKGRDRVRTLDRIKAGLDFSRNR
jgi:hypothetical protein